ncbi:2-octaprenyl-6-methoxyphenyl hydroxylase [Aliikangiella sp. G2MR2-5]|uniref:2-octaprenyl-6-methoxyphenyl hydroxylase n=1 Tax=Aliikangiella sp. G2MR2-5 TaxID=2788943 RepID=UPI0018AA8EED
MSSPAEPQNFDIAVVGGGMAGAIAAFALARLGLSIALVEPVEPGSNLSSSFDQRAVALSAASVKILETLGLWQAIQHLACPIEKIHVSEQGQFGFARFDSKNYKQSAFGEVIPLDDSGPLIWECLSNQENIKLFCPWEVTNLKQAREHSELLLVSVADKRQKLHIKASLTLACDGTFSRLAKASGIKVNRYSYDQYAVIANIVTELPHDNRAFERFTPGGPLALLPLTGNRMSLVWCHKPDDVENMMDVEDDVFLAQLQQAFGYRLGKIRSIGKRFSYPLASHWAEAHYQGRLLLLGNASHTLHPIAGQGFNLGLRDIAMLTDCIRDDLLKDNCIGGSASLKRFVDSRQADWQKTSLATDILARLFSREFLPLQIGRNKLLSGLNRIPWLKKRFAIAAMGLDGKSSRLARGLSGDLSQKLEAK